MKVNVNGVYLGMKYAVPAMRDNGQGSIINVASIASLVGGSGANGGSHGYATSKGAVLTLSMAATQSYAEDRIRVNTIHPGPIYTPIMDKAGVNLEDAQKIYRVNIPLSTLMWEKQVTSPMPPSTLATTSHALSLVKKSSSMAVL